MRRVKLELCYDGSNYAGWQVQPKQPNVKTIQGELEKAAERVVGERVEVLGSGRTDAGVHALYQVAAFSTASALPPETLARALNAFLPRDIRIWRATEADLDFHPIRDVLRKRYRYLASDSRPAFPFFRRNVWNLLQRTDVESMREAASFLMGTRDFSAFQTIGSPRKTTVRTIYDVRVERLTLDQALTFPKLIAQRNSNERNSNERNSNERTSAHVGANSPFIEEPGLISFEVEADGFLYNMVRAIVGTLYMFGQRHKGFENPETMERIVERADRKLAGPTAPPHGLYMIDVVYPND